MPVTKRFLAYLLPSGYWAVWDRGKNERVGDVGLTEKDAKANANMLNEQQRERTGL